MLGTVGGRPGLRRLLVSYLLRGQFAVPGQQASRAHGKDRGPALPRDEPGQRSEPGPIGWLVPHPPGVPPQHRVSRAGAPAVRRLSPDRLGTPGRLGRITSAARGRRSSSAPDQPTITAPARQPVINRSNLPNRVFGRHKIHDASRGKPRTVNKPGHRPRSSLPTQPGKRSVDQSATRAAISESSLAE